MMKRAPKFQKGHLQVTGFEKAKELLGTPVQMFFFSFSDQIIFLKHLDA